MNKRGVVLAIWAILVLFMAGAETEDTITGLILTAASAAQMVAIGLICRKIEK